MSWSMGLHIGEHFTEVAAQRANTLIQKRFFTAQMTPETGLGQFLNENVAASGEKIDRIELSTSLPWSIIGAHHGSPMAVLTTAGFEHWLAVTQPFQTRYFSTRPKRAVPLFDDEFIFGVTERINAEGHIEKLLDEAELEFLCAKLDLHQIKNVALCFLQSHKNDANETRAQKYLEAKGFSVYASSSFKVGAGDEKVRFWTTILNTYCRTLVSEKLQKIYDLFLPFLASPEAARVAGLTWSDAIAGRAPPLALGCALTDSLTANFARVSPLLYCGAEEFLFLPGHRDGSDTSSPLPLTEYGLVSQIAKPFVRPSLQPLTLLGQHFLSPIAFQSETVSFDPGPIVFGRGMTATFFDLLSTQPTFVAPSGLQEKMNERGRTRLQENMVAYARSSSDKMNLSAEVLIQFLVEIGAQKLRDELISCSGGAAKDCQLAGPLAPTLVRILSNGDFKAHLVSDEFIATKSLLLGGSPP